MECVRFLVWGGGPGFWRGAPNPWPAWAGSDLRVKDWGGGDGVNGGTKNGEQKKVEKFT